MKDQDKHKLEALERFLDTQKAPQIMDILDDIYRFVATYGHVLHETRHKDYFWLLDRIREMLYEVGKADHPTRLWNDPESLN